MVETGFARATNAQNVLMKNSVDLGACAIAFWVTGYALGFGGGVHTSQDLKLTT